MGFLNSLTGVLHGLGIIKKDPYDEPYTGPEYYNYTTDKYGNITSILVKANSGHESLRHLKGTVVQGDRSFVSTHLTDTDNGEPGRGWYDVHIENWDKNGKGMTRSNEYDPNAWATYEDEKYDEYYAPQPTSYEDEHPYLEWYAYDDD
jgi:hypothetical protein